MAINVCCPEGDFWRDVAKALGLSRGNVQKDLLLEGLAARMPEQAAKLKEIRRKYLTVGFLFLFTFMLADDNDFIARAPGRKGRDEFAVVTEVA